MSKSAVGAALIIVTSALANSPWAQTAIPPSPKDFAIAAAQSDQYEILAGRAAQVEGRDPRVRAFAQEMIRDHTRSSQELHEVAISAGLPPPLPGMSGDQASFLGSLQSMVGADFDSAYARQQALANAQAAAVEESFAATGADPNLRKSAQLALPMIRDHLKTALQLCGQVGGC